MNDLPSYEQVLNFNVTGTPRNYHIRPSVNNEMNEIEILDAVPDVFINGIINAYQDYVGVGRFAASSLIRGQMIIQGGGNSSALHEVDQDNVGDFIRRIREIITEKFESIGQSNREVRVQSLEFSFYFDQTSFRVGAGGSTEKTKDRDRKKYSEKLWKVSFFGDEVKINCAVFAFMYQLKKRPQRVSQGLLREMARVQIELGIGEYVAPSDLYKLVEMFPTRQLIVLGMSTHRMAHFKGKQYDSNEIAGESKTRPVNTIVLHLDEEKHHYTEVPNPTPFIKEARKMPNHRIRLCYHCGVTVYGDHNCLSDEPNPKRARKSKECQSCPGEYHQTSKDCPFTKCATCKEVYKKVAKGKAQNDPQNYHRCCVISEGEKKSFYTNGETDGKKPVIVVWDTESQMVYKDEENVQIPRVFPVDEEDRFVNVNLRTVQPITSYHKLQLICVSVVGGPKKTFLGRNCFIEFITWAFSYNQGNMYLYAHNSGGYDTRLILHELTKRYPHKTMGKVPKPVCRGSKFLSLNLGKMKFLDSLNHLPGSLRNLAKSFKGGVELRKGFFPYSFNTPENEDYVGPLPDEKYFDLPFSIKTDEDYDEFKKWYAERKEQGDWNLKEELISYCENDVAVLENVIVGFMKEMEEAIGFNPLQHITGPSALHDYTLRENTRMMELPPEKSDERLHAAEEHAKNGWAVLRPEEYHFARGALRGGRTDAR